MLDNGSATIKPSSQQIRFVMDGLSWNPLPSEEDRTDARMHYESPVTAVAAGLALLACAKGLKRSRRQLTSQSLVVLRRMETRRQPGAVPLTPHLVMFGRTKRL
jgi:hypothetical protein